MILSLDCSNATPEDEDNRVMGITLNRLILSERVYEDLDMEATSESYYEDRCEMHEVFMSNYKRI